jgi:hypothetical protein
MSSRYKLSLLAGFFLSISTPALCDPPAKDVTVGDDAPNCPVPVGVTAVKIPDGMPAALRQTLETSLGDIALPGEPFDSTDVIVHRINRRYIFVWNRGRNWLIATEHGGRGYNDPVLEYAVSDDGQSVFLVRTRIAFPQTLCTVATSFIEE